MSNILTPANMAWLSDNYLIGIGVLTGIISVVYLTISILLIVKARKAEIGMAVTGMLPIVNIIVYFVSTRDYRKQKKLDKFRESVDMDGEIEF